MRCKRACVGRNCLNISGLLLFDNVFVRFGPEYCRVYFGLWTPASNLISCFTLGDGTANGGGEVVLVWKASFCFTLGDGVGIGSIDGSDMDVGSTLGASARTGISVALRNISAHWMKALVVLEPYSNVGMLRLGSCRIASKSVAAWRR